MVDSIKSKPPQQLSGQNPKTAKIDQLKKGFKDLSSGLRVSDVVHAEVKASASSEAKESRKVGNALRNLNDAISFSALALQSLEKVAEDAERSENEVAAVQDFASNLDQIRGDIQNTLKELKVKLERGRVAQENIEASDAKLQDVDAALNQAEDTGNKIESDGQKAIDAHRLGGLTPERVAELLAE